MDVPNESNIQLHHQLEQLAREAQQHPPNSQQRQVALSKLIQLIQKSGKLYCKRKSQFPLEVYQEALQETFLELCRKIDRYDPTKAKVLTWVNHLLCWRFLDVSDLYMETLRRELSLDTPIGNTDTCFLDTLAQPVETHPPTDKVAEYINKDPEGLLQRKHVKDRPEANFREIALRRLAKESWKTLSNDWGIPLPTLSRFYERSCQQFAPKIQEYLENQ